MRESLLKIGRDLRNVFRDSQDEVLWQLRGDIFALAATYRLICWGISRNGEPPAFQSLPRRLRIEDPDARGGISRCGSVVTQRDYLVIKRRIGDVLQRAADAAFTVSSRTRRSVESLADEVERVTKQSNDKYRRGPYSQPVWCEQLRRWFRSNRAAAQYLGDLTGSPLNRSAIRTAIVRNCFCRGYRFTYEGPEECRPEIGKVYNNRCSLPIKMTIDGISTRFSSLMKAASHIGVCPSTLKRALLDGEGKAFIGQMELTFDVPSEQKDSVELIKPVESLFCGIAVIRRPRLRRVSRKDRQPIKMFGQQGTLDFAGTVA